MDGTVPKDEMMNVSASILMIGSTAMVLKNSATYGAERYASAKSIVAATGSSINAVFAAVWSESSFL